MNSTEDSTGAATAPAPKDLYELFESPISDAVRMVSILQKLTEDMLEKDLETILGKNGKCTYHIVHEEREDVLFALYHVRDYVRNIATAFEEAIR